MYTFENSKHEKVNNGTGHVLKVIGEEMLVRHPLLLKTEITSASPLLAWEGVLLVEKDHSCIIMIHIGK